MDNMNLILQCNVKDKDAKEGENIYEGESIYEREDNEQKQK